jgi:uncharacterized membrane protein YphA (DoxX/SURF4 family)
MPTTTLRKRATTKADVLLWVAQAVLALLFLFAGGMKLATPASALAKMTTLPVPFMRFIGVCEVSGALGLILPGLLRIRQYLTPLAAAGLVIIMTGATIVTLAGGQRAGALVPFAVGLVAASIAYARRNTAPFRSAGRNYQS